MCSKWALQNWPRQGPAHITWFWGQSFVLLNRFLQFCNFSNIWSTLKPKSHYKNVKILAQNGHFLMDWSLKINLSNHLHRNSKIHFLTLTSHFENFWIIVLSHFFEKKFVKLTFLLKKILKSWFDEFFWGATVNF